MYYKDIESKFPDTCNYGVTEDKIVEKFMILKTLPRTLEEFKDDISDEYAEGMEEFVNNAVQSFFSFKDVI